MKPAPFAYHAPEDLDEVTALLAELGTDGKVLAGGQSLVPMLNMRLAAPQALVDISRVSGLDRVTVSGGAVRVGARVTHEHLLRNPQAHAAVPLLRQALQHVAHPVIRHRGTTVGSIVHADPAAEMPAVLMLLGGDVEAVSSRGTRHIPAAEFIVGPMESALAADEVAVAAQFLVPSVDSATVGTSFVELARRHGDYAMVGVGALVAIADGTVISARLAFIGVGDGPVVVDVSAQLAGLDVEAPNDDRLADGQLAQVVGAAIDPSDDIHATGDYRRHLAGVLAARAIRAASVHAQEVRR